MCHRKLQSHLKTPRRSHGTRVYSGIKRDTASEDCARCPPAPAHRPAGRSRRPAAVGCGPTAAAARQRPPETPRATSQPSVAPKVPLKAPKPSGKLPAEPCRSSAAPCLFEICDDAAHHKWAGLDVYRKRASYRDAFMCKPGTFSLSRQSVC